MRILKEKRYLDRRIVLAHESFGGQLREDSSFISLDETGFKHFH